MQIVGVDFGTTNVRIATWDTDEQDRLPEPQAIGPVDSFAMPSVIAFQRRRDGTITTVVGQDADELQDSRDVVVVRNIKRWALSSDPFVCWHLESAYTPRPEWWNSQTRCIEVWGQEFPVREAIRLILDEAFRRSSVTGEFEWRTGCPVHTSLEYRSELASVLSEFGGVNSVTSVIEEPVLFLALAQKGAARSSLALISCMTWAADHLTVLWLKWMRTDRSPFMPLTDIRCSGVSVSTSCCGNGWGMKDRRTCCAAPRSVSIVRAPMSRWIPAPICPGRT